MRKLILFMMTLLSASNLLAQDISTLKDSLRFTGNIGLRTLVYAQSGIENRRSPFSYVLTGEATISKGDFSIPLSFTYSEQDRSFSQPFNTFGISPTYKWLRVHLGYQNLNWNQFTMGGHQMLGAGFEITQEKIKAGFFYGRLQRATAQNALDSVLLNTYLPAYKRMGYTAFVAFGKTENNLHLSFLSAKDDTTNLPDAFLDSNYQVTPGKNLAIGIKGNLKLTKFAFAYLEGGYSAFNRNVLAQELEYETWGFGKAAARAWKPNIATQLYNGLEGGLRFQIKTGPLQIYYKRISPDYQSMGIYFINNDVQAIGLNQNLNLFKNKINLNYTLNRFTDNLNGKKLATTTRFQPNVQLSFNPSTKWGVDAGWSNLYTNQSNPQQGLLDTILMSQNNPGFNISPRVVLMNSKHARILNLGYFNMRLNDFNAFTAAYANYQTQLINVLFNQSNLETNLSFGGGINYTQNTTSLFQEQGFGANANISKSYKDGIASISGGVATQITNVNTNFSTNLNGVYRLKKKSLFTATINFMLNKSDDLNSRSFQEYLGILSYQYQF